MKGSEEHGDWFETQLPIEQIGLKPFLAEHQEVKRAP